MSVLHGDGGELKAMFAGQMLDVFVSIIRNKHITIDARQLLEQLLVIYVEVAIQSSARAFTLPGRVGGINKPSNARSILVFLDDIECITVDESDSIANSPDIPDSSREGFWIPTR